MGASRRGQRSGGGGGGGGGDGEWGLVGLARGARCVVLSRLAVAVTVTSARATWKITISNRKGRRKSEGYPISRSRIGVELFAIIVFSILDFSIFSIFVFSKGIITVTHLFVTYSLKVNQNQ
jgi:hypothetical protein